MYNQIIILGVVVSIFFSELTGLSPAGIIVPGYIALCLHTPQRIFYTLAVALLACGANRLLSNFIILYGRRRFVVMIILASCIDAIIRCLIDGMALPSFIGIIVPGIIASEFEKQGIVRSLISLGITVGIISLILLGCGISVLRI